MGEGVPFLGSEWLALFRGVLSGPQVPAPAHSETATRTYLLPGLISWPFLYHLRGRSGSLISTTNLILLPLSTW